MSTPQYYSLTQATRPTSLSFGQWFVVLIVAALVAAVTAAAVVFAAMQMGGADVAPMEPPAWNDDGGSADADGGGGAAHNDGGSTAQPTPAVDHSDPQAVVEAYVLGVNTQDGPLMLACMEPMENNGGAGSANAPAAPEYPKTTLRLLEIEPWRSADGEWMAYAIEMASVMQDGVDPTLFNYGQWVVKLDGQWFIATTSAAKAPMSEDSYMDWFMRLNG